MKKKEKSARKDLKKSLVEVQLKLKKKGKPARKDLRLKFALKKRGKPGREDLKKLHAGMKLALKKAKPADGPKNVLVGVELAAKVPVATPATKARKPVMKVWSTNKVDTSKRAKLPTDK